MRPRSPHFDYRPTGTTPLHWLIDARVRRAQEMLERTALPVERIAVEVGFDAPLALREHFRRAVGVDPKEYRRSFGKTSGLHEDDAKLPFDAELPAAGGLRTRSVYPVFTGRG